MWALIQYVFFFRIEGRLKSLKSKSTDRKKAAACLSCVRTPDISRPNNPNTGRAIHGCVPKQALLPACCGCCGCDARTPAPVE